MKLLAVAGIAALASAVVIAMSAWSYMAPSLDALMVQASKSKSVAMACQKCPSCHAPNVTTFDSSLSVANKEKDTKSFHSYDKMPEHFDNSEYSNCSFVYLDVGTNIGVQIRKLFEPARYPKAPVLPIFDEHFGTDRKKLASSGSLCVIGIEMNPNHTNRLHELERHYKNKCRYRVHILTETAASTFDGRIDFWSDGDLKRKEWGASTIMPKQDINAHNDLEETKAVSKGGNIREKRTVRSLDLANFINSALAPHAKKIVMKLDIEGAEHNILPRLIMTGALCSVDLFFMEEHMLKFTAAQRTVFLQAKALFPDVARAAGCKAEMSMLDDETYLDDADDTINTC
jgi:hypothetical protein